MPISRAQPADLPELAELFAGYLDFYQVPRPLPEVSLRAMQLAVDLIPSLAGTQVIRSWSGIDGRMPDVIPVIGPSRTTPGLFHAFGFSGHGFQLGPAIGAIMTELELDGRTDIPLDAFRIDRFGESAA